MTETAYRLDKVLVRSAFGRASSSYDANAALQREICDLLLSRLDQLKCSPLNLLDAGSGTGHGASQLRTRFPEAFLLTLDLAESMLLTANTKLNSSLHLNHTASVCADIDRMPLKSGSVDMVWSNVALQWCNDLSISFSEIKRILKPGGLLVFSTFGPKTLFELRQAFNKIDKFSHVNRFIDLLSIHIMLIQAGFDAPSLHTEYFVPTYTNLKALMKELKAIGAHNVTAGRLQGLTGRSRWKAVENAYEEFRKDGFLPATYEVIYGHAVRRQS